MVFRKLLPTIFFLNITFFTLIIIASCSSPEKKEKHHLPTTSVTKVSSPQSVKQDFTKQYNVFMIVSDALRQDALGCYGGKAKTPNIDRLAEHGVRFKNSYSTSPWTVPSSVSMFTGNNPTTYSHVPFGNLSVQIRVPDQEVLLPEALNYLGYQTKMMIENPNARLHNNLQGLEHISFYKSWHFDTFFSQSKKNAISAVIGEKLQDGITYKPVYVWVDQILSLNANSNFFYLQWFLDPHSPYTPPPDFAVSVDSQQLSKPLQIYKEPLPPNEDFSAYENAYNKKLYLAEVESVDKRVGMLIDALGQKHLLDKTYIILTADHGEQFGEHGQTGHGGFGRGTNFYETLLRVPLIISGPGIAGGREVDAPVSLLGLMPTIKEMLGLSYSDTMQGKSFAPLVLGTNNLPPDSIYFSNVVQDEPAQRDALLEGGYKLISRSANNYELYNLWLDPGETDDLSDKSPRIVAEMSRNLNGIRSDNHRRLAENERLEIKKAYMNTAEKESIINHLKELGYTK